MKARLPWILLALTIVVVVFAMLPLKLGREPLNDTLLYGLVALAFGTMGTLVVSRQPANRIGWIFCGFGVWTGVIETWGAFAYHSWPTGAVATWVISWIWICEVTVFALVFLLFPDGRLMTRRWRFVIWLLVVGALIGIPGQALNPDNTIAAADGSNPYAVESAIVQVVFSVGILLMLAGLIASVISVVIRYRRATGVERLQLKQLVFAGSVIIIVMAAAVPFFYDSIIIQVAVPLSFLGLPIAAALAIVRYRLYDLDVVINRALVYTMLTASLVIVYFTVVVGAGSLLRAFSGTSSSIVVAASTLLVAGLFRPLRSRIQQGVDRRFYRRRYDAARTLDRFSARLRDEIDLDSLQAELQALVHETVQPTHVSVWLRPVHPNRRND